MYVHPYALFFRLTSMSARINFKIKYYAPSPFSSSFLICSFFSFFPVRPGLSCAIIFNIKTNPKRLKTVGQDVSTNRTHKMHTPHKHSHIQGTAQWCSAFASETHDCCVAFLPQPVHSALLVYMEQQWRTLPCCPRRCCQHKDNECC